MAELKTLVCSWRKRNGEGTRSRNNSCLILRTITNSISKAVDFQGPFKDLSESNKPMKIYRLVYNVLSSL